MMLDHLELEEFAESLPAALSAADVTDLVLPLAEWFSVGDQAVASLVLSLAGLQRLGLLQTPMQGESILGHLCRTLSAQSPLTELLLQGNSNIDSGFLDLAALIAHNQTRLRTLSLHHYRLVSGGCDCPLSTPAVC
jgi:hypothetical protein